MMLIISRGLYIKVTLCSITKRFKKMKKHLSRHITNSMATLFRSQPQLLPESLSGSNEFYIDAYASALGHGLTAVLRVWLNSENRDVEEYTSAVLNTLPVWMLMSGATGGSPQGSVLNVSSKELERN